MTRITGSTAGPAFHDARATLDARALSSPRLRPAIDYTLPPPTPRVARPSLNGSTAGPAPEPTGPIHSALVALASGETTASELVEAALAAVDRDNDHYRGLVEVDRDGARAAAARLDDEHRCGVARGPLHGVPITVKDVIDVAGLPTRAGSLAYLGRPTQDAVAVARLRAAGAIVLGKAATHEFALGVTSPQSRNPRDPERIPGGSSGGSAVAVITGMGLGSLGTDTRASIRVPAALSGAVGFKPTYGRIPTDGVLALSWTMDHVAPLAATVGDAALLLEVLFDGPRVLGDLPPPARIGVPAAPFKGCDPAVEALVRAALDVLAALGHALEPTERPDDLDLDVASAGGLVVSRCEAATAHRSLGLNRSLYWDEVADQLAAAESITAMDYLDAQRVRADLGAAMAGVFAHHDVLAMPTVPVVAPPRTDFARYLMVLARNAIPWSFIGFPAISVPCGSQDGLPVGLQLVGPPGSEPRLAALALSYEAATTAWP
ncbi:MAG: amidase [Acidimicrobiales bacterium]|nr:amidase [Acidimicrobiales bacterium]